jgi:hypothetical protein
MARKERDPSTDVPADEATKPQKPKKAFEVTVTVWDDGEITNKLVEFIKKERGAPEKWLRKPPEFNEAIKKNISENPVLLLENIAEGLGINLSAFFAARPKVETSEKKIADATTK